MSNPFSPDWLKYGFLGLVAIALIATFFIIRQLITNDPRKRLWVIVFLIAAFIFLLFGGVSSYFNSKTKTDKIHYDDSLACANQSLNNKLTILNDSTPEGKNLRTKVERSHKVNDSLEKLNKLLNAEIILKDSSLTYVAYNYIDEAIEADLKATSLKSKSIPEVDFKRLRRAVFLSILDFGGNSDILKKALKIHQNESENLSITDDDIRNVVSELPKLMRIRRDWLKDQVILTLETAINNRIIQDSKPMPNGQQRQQQQQPITVSVPLPTSIAVTNDGETVEFTNNDLSNLKRELDLIGRLLSAVKR